MRHSLYVLRLCPCLDLCLFISNLCDLFFIFIFIFVIVNRIISWIQTHTFLCLFFRIFPITFGWKRGWRMWMKLSLNVLLSIFLIFCQFQPGVAYKSFAYKKSVYIAVPSLRLYFNGALNSLWIVSSKMLSRKFSWEITEAVSQTNTARKAKFLLLTPSEAVL